ncbi:hypothetical protein ALO82_100890 [Pseudomonas syringae pv. broussonetiae]|uniref:Uncharacterized protein n=1 Tax=Pseudomonas savastanoi TaxID=29438 RepID=A0A3M5K1K6_PSESS|nr:hypothetical protein ALO82_100890 [Pseudomonas syringae pv. broussonetiae]RMT29293.1 hypothetical protein ALP51_01682 [Pseudomonas savastanoi]
MIQLLKSGWLRAFASTEARILQCLLYLSSGYFKKLSKFPLQLQPLALRSTLQLLISGRRILQRYNRVSNSFFSPLSITADSTSFLADSSLQTLVNH